MLFRNVIYETFSKYVIDISTLFVDKLKMRIQFTWYSGENLRFENLLNIT